MNDVIEDSLRRHITAVEADLCKHKNELHRAIMALEDAQRRCDNLADLLRNSLSHTRETDARWWFARMREWTDEFKYLRDELKRHIRQSHKESE